MLLELKRQGLHNYPIRAQIKQLYLLLESLYCSNKTVNLNRPRPIKYELISYSITFLILGRENENGPWQIYWTLTGFRLNLSHYCLLISSLEMVYRLHTHL